MASEDEIVEILLQSSGQEDLEESARKTVKTWQDAFRLIEDAYPDPIDAFDDIVDDINRVKDAISQGFQVEGVDWTSLFSDMEDTFKDSAGRIDVTDWWDSILQAMLASGIGPQYIGQFVQDFESQLRDALGDIDADPPDIDFTDTEQQLRDLLSLFSGMSTVGLGNLFDIQSVEEFRNAIAGLHDLNLNHVNRTMDELAARVGNMNIDDIIKDETIARLKEFQEALNQIQFDPTEDAITQIQQVLDDLGQDVQLDLSNIFDLSGIDDIREAISNLSENELRQLYDYLDQTADRIQHLNIDEAIKEGTVTQLREYLELIRQINEAHNDREGDSKLTQFLDRYKYSLALIGGALVGIMGMMRYSTTFGTALDVIGQAIGYLADVIMYPLLPYVMLLAEWIIGLADWFNALPDPIKGVITAILGVAAAFLLLKSLPVSKYLEDVGIALSRLGPIGWFALGLLALGLAAFLTNFGNFKDNIGLILDDIYNLWQALINGDFDSAIKIGVQLVFDILKTGEDLATSVEGVMKWASQKAGEVFSTNFLNYALWAFNSNIFSIWNFGKSIEEYIAGLTLEKAGQDLANLIFDGMMTAQFPAYRFIKGIVSGDINMQDLKDFGASMGQNIIDGAVTAVLGGAGKIFENFVTGAFRGAYKWGAVNLGGMTPEDADKMMTGIADANDKSYNIPGISDLMRPVNQEDTVQRYIDEQSKSNLLNDRIKLLENKISDLSFSAPELTKLDLSKLDNQGVYDIDALLDRIGQYNITKYPDFKDMMEQIGADPTSKYKGAYDLLYPNAANEITWKGPDGSAYPDLSEFDPVNQGISPGLDLPDANVTSQEINTWWKQVMSEMDVTLPVSTDISLPSEELSGSPNVPQLPSSPAPVPGAGTSTQQPESKTEIVNYNTFHINGYQKDTRQLADEIARIWDSKSRGSRI